MDVVELKFVLYRESMLCFWNRTRFNCATLPKGAGFEKNEHYM